MEASGVKVPREIVRNASGKHKVGPAAAVVPQKPASASIFATPAPGWADSRGTFDCAGAFVSRRGPARTTRLAATWAVVVLSAIAQGRIGRLTGDGIPPAWRSAAHAALSGRAYSIGGPGARVRAPARCPPRVPRHCTDSVAFAWTFGYGARFPRSQGLSGSQGLPRPSAIVENHIRRRKCPSSRPRAV